MAPILVFESGQSFGELALLSRQPRKGTVLTLTDCFFAVINADGFEKLLKKDTQCKLTASVRFLRQIPYIRNWLIKETEILLYNCKEKKISSRGTVLAKEGTMANKVYIILEGEVQIFKQNLKDVFYNH